MIVMSLILAFVFEGGGAENLANSVFQKHQPAIEAAVEKALRYLASNQSEDGTFNDSYGRSVGVV